MSITSTSTDPAILAALQAGEECRLAAHAGLARGWSVLVLCPPDHVGVGKGHPKICSHPGKVPLHEWAPLQEDRLDPDEIERLFRQYPNANVGLALGPVSGLVRVDVDGAAGQEKLHELSGGDLPPTLQFTSGRVDGYGLLYAIPAGAELKTTPFDTGAKSELRFQAKGAETVLPPSRHHSGGRYRWLPGHGPDEIEAAIMPAWLVKAMSAEWVRPERKLRSDNDGPLFGCPISRNSVTLWA